MTPLEIIVPGEPIAKARPVVTASGTFTPERSRNHEARVKMAAQIVMRGREPLEGAVIVDVVAHMGIPKSWPRKRKAAAVHGELAHTKRPDLDNLTKLVLDGLNGVVWVDDSQIIGLSATKIYGVTPGVVIGVTEPDGDAYS